MGFCLESWQLELYHTEYLLALYHPVRPKVGRCAYNAIAETIKRDAQNVIKNDPIALLPRASQKDDRSTNSSSDSSVHCGDNGTSIRPMGFMSPIHEMETMSYIEDDGHVFEHVNGLIFNLFAPNTPLALRIVQGLQQLPREQRALVYDFDRYIHHFAGDSSLGNPSDTLGGTLQQTSNSARSTSPGAPAQATRTKRRRQRGEYPFACPFNIFRSDKFRIQYGPNGHDLFKSCSGPGWTDIKNLGDHIRKVHMRPQCPRCWETWDSDSEFQDHIRSETRCPDLSQRIDNVESISSTVFEKVKKILSTSRTKKKKSAAGAALPPPDAREKWYSVKREIFPPTKYPHFPDPEHPFYQDPDGKLTKLGGEKLEKARKLAKAILKAKADDARKADLVSQASEYRLHCDEVEELVVKVVEILDRSTSRTGTPAPTACEEGTGPQDKSRQISQQATQASSGFFEHGPWSEHELVDMDFEELLRLPPL